MKPAYTQDHRYALILRISREVAARIEDTYLRLENITKPTMGFHITLLGPFYLGHGASLDSLRQVARVCAQWHPFNVEVAGVGVFRESGDNTVYLQVTNPTDIVALHEAVANAAAERIEIPDEASRRWNYEAYYPHITLGLRLSDRRAQELSINVSQQRFREVFQANCVSLVRQERTGPWQYLLDYPFNAGQGADCKNPYLSD